MFLAECNYTCHEVCVFGDDKDKIKCSAIDQETGNCRICKKKCQWDKHKNAKFIIQSRQVTQYVVPEELVKHWNFNTNSLEGAALDAMKEYITLQDQLKDYITLLVDITSHINNIALKHNPEALLNYLDFLVKSARAQGCHSAQLQALIKV